MVFDDKNVGVDGTKTLINAKKWDVYNSKKDVSVKGRYSVDIYYKDWKRLIWEVIDDDVVEEGVEHEKLVLRGFWF